MDINKEAFDKLKQLDRIEFRQRYKNIVEEYSYDFGVSYYITLLIFVFIANIWSILQTGHNIISISLMYLIFQIITLGILLDIFLMLVYYSLTKKHIRNLENKYFTIEQKRSDE